ncbi:hypothetical protein FRC11_009529, partial [Ceratobasidium sp. 423]
MARTTKPRIFKKLTEPYAISSDPDEKPKAKKPSLSKSTAVYLCKRCTSRFDTKDLLIDHFASNPECAKPTPHPAFQFLKALDTQAQAQAPAEPAESNPLECTECNHIFDSGESKKSH